MAVKKALREGDSQSTPKSRNQRPEFRTLVDMRPSQFVVIALLALTTIPPDTLACQETHMRHSAELICNDSNVCTIEYEREFLFNKLHREACVYLKYRNQTIGQCDWMEYESCISAAPLLVRRQQKIRRFTETHMILDDGFKPAVECPSADAALGRFNSCKNKIICACSTSSDAARCLCPQHTLRAIRNSTTCSTTSEANHLKLEYNRAQVQDRCRYQCGVRTYDILLTGTLLYHSTVTDDEIFDGSSKKVNDSFWEHFSIPDITPLMMTFALHWKIALSVIAAFAIVAPLIYAFGPSVISAFTKAITAIVELLVRTLLACLGGAVGACQKAVNDSTRQ
ncbi:hypothetical protein COOONC_00865 [Cooperia oncophora]